MKILHTADLHLGAPLRTHLPPKEAKLRRDELLSVFHRILELAKRENCAAVLIAGDLFDSANAATMLASTVLGAIGECREIDFYYVAGNHEKEDWLSRKLPENLHVFGKYFSCYEKENVTFFGKSFPKPTDFDNIYLQKDRINILLLHGEWGEGEARSAEIPIGLLKNKGIDYCALGHYHSYGAKPIDARGIAAYSGCPEGRGFDELGEKGAILIETSGGRVAHRFIPTASRIFHRAVADISAAKSLLEVFSACEAAVSLAKGRDFVRLVLTGKRAHIPPPDTEAIRRHFGDRFYYLEIEDGSVAAPNFGTIAKENSLRGEFVRTVLCAEGLCEEEKMRILDLGLAALSADAGGGALWS